MASQGAPLCSEMDLSLLKFSEPQKGKAAGGGPSSMHIYVNTTNQKPFEFQMNGINVEDRSRIVFEVPPPASSNAKVNLALSVNGKDDALRQFWADYDSLCIAHVAKHSAKFLKQQMTEDEVRAIWRPCLRETDGYDPYIKARFDSSPEAKIPFESYDANVKKKRFAKIHYSQLSRGDEVMVFVRPGMLYYFQGKVGSTVDITYLVRFSGSQMNKFPFRMAGVDASTFNEVGIDDLFSEEDFKQMEAVANSYYDSKRKKEEQADDGSTVTIDPITMQPVAQADDVQPAPAKRRKRA